MKKVEKKILSKWFDLVCSGDKTFEFRKDEDNIQEGDILILITRDKAKAAGWL